jgi:dihydroorotate dehydrogenase
MAWYRKLAWPLLVRRDPERAHEGALHGLRLAQGWRFGRFLLHTLRGPVPSDPVTCCGLTFPNRLGMAAGFDKDVQVAPALAALGFGHVEVGTLTPHPQAGNPHPRIFRLPEDGALINRMGFPNGGVLAALPRLRALAAQRRDWVLGVSLGKQKETALEEASADYIAVMRQVWPYADYLAVNVSSPNTPGLRALQGGAYLGQMLADLAAARRELSAETRHNPPLLVKIAPDLTDAELDAILQAAHDHAVDGLIATNTTLGRDGLRSPRRDEAGGLSGEPLRLRSRALVATIAQRSSLPVIGVGGVATSADCRAMLDAGATLVQLYTALVYAGPGLPGRLLRGE